MTSGPAGDFYILGFLARALDSLYGFLNLGRNGDTLPSAAAPSIGDDRLSFTPAFTNVCVSQGTNDTMIGSTATAATVVNAVAAWTLFSTLGARVFQTTATPQTTSTDTWATTANQTPVTTNTNAGEPGRQAFNAWLRSGAPITGGVAVTGTGTVTNGSNQITSVSGTFVNGETICGQGIPAGTTITAGGGTSTLTVSANATGSHTGERLFAGTVVAGAAGHPLHAVWDTAATIESTPAGVTGAGGSVWQVAAATADGVHPGSAGHALMAAACTVADLV